jgi:hypothetical protein
MIVFNPIFGQAFPLPHPDSSTPQVLPNSVPVS